MTDAYNRPEPEPTLPEYDGASEEEIDTYYAWEYRPEYEQIIEESKNDSEE